MLADRLRWRREHEERRNGLAREYDERQRGIRRDIYANYLAALSKLRNSLREVAHTPTLSSDQRAEKLREAFLSSGAYELRFQIQLCAPRDAIDGGLVALAERAYKSLRTLRVQIEAGASYEDERYLTARDAYHNALDALGAAMREDLGLVARVQPSP